MAKWLGNISAKTGAEARKKAKSINPEYTVTKVELKEKGYGRPSEYSIWGNLKKR